MADVKAEAKYQVDAPNVAVFSFTGIKGPPMEDPHQRSP